VFLAQPAVFMMHQIRWAMAPARTTTTTPERVTYRTHLEAGRKVDRGPRVTRVIVSNPPEEVGP
jgi:hypothetical protein